MLQEWKECYRNEKNVGHCLCSGLIPEEVRKWILKENFLERTPHGLFGEICNLKWKQGKHLLKTYSETKMLDLTNYFYIGDRHLIASVWLLTLPGIQSRGVNNTFCLGNTVKLFFRDLSQTAGK